jgi:2,4-dienoyl-CoA reductase-like NADH-dependent reductase (Old Yellow Enzyme family)
VPAAGIQLAHAGRKASTGPPWAGTKRLTTPEEGAWDVVATQRDSVSRKRSYADRARHAGIREIVRAFADAARRSIEAGIFDPRNSLRARVPLAFVPLAAQ